MSPHDAPHARKAEFEEHALPHIDALFNLALHLTRNRRDAEDLVQEAYLRAYRFFDTYQPGSHLKAWLFRILRNAFINRYRAAKARPEEVGLERVERAYAAAIDDVFLREHSPPSPEALLLERVVDGEVEQALEALPEEYRTVVILALVEELSYREIADALAIPIGTVMSRLHRGRKQLQASLLEFARRRGIGRRPTAVEEVDEGGDPRVRGS